MTDLRYPICGFQWTPPESCASGALAIATQHIDVLANKLPALMRAAGAVGWGRAQSDTRYRPEGWMRARSCTMCLTAT